MTVAVNMGFWLYCPECGHKVQGAAPATCHCGGKRRIWKDPDGKPPPDDVSTIVKRGTGM